MSEEIQESEPEAFTESADSPQRPGGGSVNASGERDAKGRFQAGNKVSAAGGKARHASRLQPGREAAVIDGSGSTDGFGGLEESDFAALGVEILRKLATDPKVPPQTRAYCAKALADKRSADVPLPRSVREVERMSMADLYAAIAALEGEGACPICGRSG